MLVSWNQPNPLTICLPKGLSIKLLPGNNEVDESMWEMAAKHPLVKFHLENEDNTGLVVKNSGDPGRKKSKSGLDGFNTKDARREIRETFDKELLASWLEKESRQVVSAEIQKQIEKINATAKPKENGGEGE